VPLVSRVERNRGLGRAFEKAVRRKALARRTRALCKLNGARRGLKLVGLDTEAEGQVRERVGARMDGRKWCDRGCEVGIGSGTRRRGAERGEPCRVGGHRFELPPGFLIASLRDWVVG
jgi:hypothetical protein